MRPPEYAVDVRNIYICIISIYHYINQYISQSINQSINQPTNQSIYLSIYLSTSWFYGWTWSNAQNCGVFFRLSMAMANPHKSWFYWPNNLRSFNCHVWLPQGILIPFQNLISRKYDFRKYNIISIYLTIYLSIYLSIRNRHLTILFGRTFRWSIFISIYSWTPRCMYNLCLDLTSTPANTGFSPPFFKTRFSTLRVKICTFMCVYIYICVCILI